MTGGAITAGATGAGTATLAEVAASAGAAATGAGGKATRLAVAGVRVAGDFFVDFNGSTVFGLFCRLGRLAMRFLVLASAASFCFCSSGNC